MTRKLTTIHREAGGLLFEVVAAKTVAMQDASP
jgi:hypothetical protein